jgi:Na+-transporting NADH:ubiquinone oxidoreductase subunit NqrD
MNILVVVINGKIPPVNFPFNLSKGLNDLRGLIITNNLLLGKHPAMGHTSLNILGIKTVVKAD